ncbi:hypothetical protein [Streptomyces sp. HGB0020]|uniref:hypothetical protein n=1 Tax=Streptomyces sp. HGB0020 TaxID=1078086 RepID=UPI00034E761E|nr:hypothetical protein [Streptomyces sp. HGB0020]EPD63194.1 hypothetical protein HMPREF1211_03535 [Streptomyces sp. HGB0020]
MTTNSHRLALPPIETEPGVLVHPCSDRRLAAEHWLLSTSRNRDRTRAEWRRHGIAMLHLGALFSAVRLPEPLVLALVDKPWDPALVDPLLKDMLDGPVICDPRHHRYYALVPASVPVTWRQAVEEWREVDVDCLGRGSILGVPRLDADRYDGQASYWSVPMQSAGVLCAPLHVARMIAAARHLLHEEPDA